MQKALIITRDTGLNELNTYLSLGAEVKHMCGMPSSVAKGDGFDVVSHPPACLVILEVP